MKAKGWIALLIVILCIIGAVIFFVTRNNNSKADDYLPVSSADAKSISDDAIKNVLEQSNFAQANFGGKSFLTFQKLGEDTVGAQVKEYIWLVEQEYYLKDGKLEKGSGVSLPVALYFNQGKAVAMNAPRQGSFYNDDIQKIFPDDIKGLPIFLDIKTRTEILAGFQAQLKKEAESHFNIQTQSVVPASSVSASSTDPTLTQPTTAQIN